MPLPRDIAGKALPTASLLNTGFFQPGDYVVPQYNESGAKTVKGQVLGDNTEIMNMAAIIAEHANMEGGTPLMLPAKALEAPRSESKAVAKPKEVKAKKNAPRAIQEAAKPQPFKLKVDGMPAALEPQPVVDLLLSSSSLKPTAPSTPPIEVVFSVPAGRIKVNASAILDSNNALILVFKDEGEIRYEPAPGSEVELIIGNRVERTMYPGFKFSWVDGVKSLMVFVKLAESE